MTCSPDALSTLIARIYDCGAEREQWQGLLAELAALMRADKAHLFCPLPAPAQEAFWVGHRISPQSLADYKSYYHSCDLLTQTRYCQELWKAWSGGFLPIVFVLTAFDLSTVNERNTSTHQG
ncbi:MAG: hypothetical protein M3461_09210 [Pseudomonadota bacterium]|nr:hypothetical protein [Pseudomonadota bacterium]